MSVGLLIVSHDSIGNELLNVATKLLGICPLRTASVPVSLDSDPDQVLEQAREAYARLNDGEGVLVLTDMYGSTPSNIANLLQESPDIRVVAGINLPMLIRVLNYPRLGLDDLVDKALSGGRDGALLCTTR